VATTRCGRSAQAETGHNLHAPIVQLASLSTLLSDAYLNLSLNLLNAKYIQWRQITTSIVINPVPKIIFGELAKIYKKTPTCMIMPKKVIIPNRPNPVQKKINILHMQNNAK
jgi:hypothetical protein